MTRWLLCAVWVCLWLPACGADDDEPPLNPEIPLNQVLNEPGAYDTISVSGRAQPLGDLGFILTQQRVSVFVDAPPSVARDIEDGEAVDLTAAVEVLGAEKVSQIESRTNLNTGDDDAVSERALADTRIEAGAPYLELIELGGSHA